MHDALGRPKVERREHRIPPGAGRDAPLGLQEVKTAKSPVDDRPVVLLHGATYGSAMFDIQVPGCSLQGFLAARGWRNFALDIRAGDQFSLVYEEQYLHGKKLHDGNILAAEFINQDHSYRAVRFTDDKGHSGYYTPDGKSVRKAFLRTPVDFKRISSRFSMHRKHPKLNKIRAHKGVDYAAARGTPIRATGDGKVIYRGVKGGYGNVVILQHGTKYSTLYGHMSRFARGVYSGRQVHQGQIIGYVGMTGLATGPHLHYEFRVNGVHRNPLTVHLPDAAPLPKQYRDTFDNTSRPLLAQLDTLKRTMLALNSQ